VASSGLDCECCLFSRSIDVAGKGLGLLGVESTAPKAVARTDNYSATRTSAVKRPFYFDATHFRCYWPIGDIKDVAFDIRFRRQSRHRREGSLKPATSSLERRACRHFAMPFQWCPTALAAGRSRRRYAIPPAMFALALEGTLKRRVKLFE
jgi:hypothetical protein